ncbi:MAG: metallophosphoesterase family protein [Eggerthellaceae bacterium]|nr:metallophosphoesterase family protein [Eggerthellaceae bacterium]
MLKLGVISDTHGFYRKEVDNLFYSCDHIFHIGDIGNSTVIEHLQQIAPVTWVKGNCDFKSMIPPNTPEEANIKLGHFRIYLTHQPEDLAYFLLRLSFDDAESKLPYICLHGHTHIGRIDRGENAAPAKLIFNPGSATWPRGFQAEQSVGYIEIDGPDIVSAKIENMEGVCLMQM